MLLATTTSSKIQVITASAVALDVHASYVDYDGASTITPGYKNTEITTAATTDVTTVPGSGVSRNLKHLNIYNTHASSANAISVQHTDGSTVVTLFAYTLGAGETLTFAEGVGWRVLDVNGNVKTTTANGTIIQSPTIQTIATDYTLAADMSMTVNRKLTINTGHKLTLASGSRYRVM